jgi:plastocyanin
MIRGLTVCAVFTPVKMKKVGVARRAARRLPARDEVDFVVAPRRIEPVRGKAKLWRTLLVLSGMALLGGGIAAADSITVSLTASGPQPLTVSVNWGDTVDFVNSDTTAHVLASTATEIGTTTVDPGQTVSATFAGTAGLKRYTMSGKPKNFIFPAVTVTLTGTLALAARPSSLTYGRSTRLVGHLVLAPGEQVELLQRPLNRFGNGSGEWRPLGGPLPTDQSGSFALGVSPAAGVEYQAIAAAGQLLSAPVKVFVMPAVRVVAPRRVRQGVAFAIGVGIRPASAASSVSLEAYVPALKRWHSLGRAHVAGGRARLLVAVDAGVTKLRISLGPHEITGTGFSSVDGKPFTVVGS